MASKAQGKLRDDAFEYVHALPVSTREESADSLLHGAGAGADAVRHFSAFDVSFEYEEDGDDLLDLAAAAAARRARCCWCCPRRVRPPEWWWRLSRMQRALVRYSSAAAGSLALLTLVLLALSTVVGTPGRQYQAGAAVSSAAATHSGPAPSSPALNPAGADLCSWSDLYLPRAVLPQRYSLHITADMAAPQYAVTGSLHIAVTASTDTRCVVLHSHGIDVTRVGLRTVQQQQAQAAVAGAGAGAAGADRRPGGSEQHQQQQQQQMSMKEVPGVVDSVSAERQQLVLRFSESLPQAQSAEIVLEFKYKLKEGLDGFYRSSFIDAENRTLILGSTQFESLAARKAFPCFDEPPFKASFEIKITAPPPPVVVLSNMPLSHTHGGGGMDEHSSAVRDGGATAGGGDGLVTYHFAPSPPMSTYLVAWVIGELAHVEAQCTLPLPAAAALGGISTAPPPPPAAAAVRTLPVRVWGTSDRAAQFGHALSVACSALQTMERLLQVPFALPKMDLVAIPNFAAGAMENWGLLTYRETALLVDPSVDDIRQRYSIATTVAHETAHQWFGDLVTLDDWTELWLNEGFATYFEVVVADAFRPEADDLFDDVSYAKGGAVLRMLRAWLNRGNGPLMIPPDGDGASQPQRLRLRRRRLARSLAHDDDHGNEDDQQDDDYAGSSAEGGGGGGGEWWTQHAHFGASVPAAAAAAAGSPGLPGAHITRAAAPLVVLPAGDDEADDTSAFDANFDGSTAAAAAADPFLKGLTKHLRASAYGSMTHSSLWRHVAEATGQPVEEWMKTWTLRRGFPIVTVSLQSSSSSTDSSSNQATVLLEQLPYHAPRTYMVGLPFEPDMYCNDWSDNPADSSWWLPVALRTAGSGKVEWHEFSNCSSALRLHVPHNGWVLANAGRFGFYRVNYSEPLWSALISAAAGRDQLGAIDLAGLLDDAYSLALARQLAINTFLELTAAVGRRAAPERAPWEITLGWLQRMSDVLANAALLGDDAGGRGWSTCLQDLRVYATGALTGPLLLTARLPGHSDPGLGFHVGAADSPDLRLLRPQLLTAAGFLGHAGVTATAVALLESSMAPGAPLLQPDITQAVYSLAVGSGDPAAYDAVQRLYEQATDAKHKQRALRALSRATTPPLIARTLEYALSAQVRSQDVAGVLVSLAKQGGTGFNATWAFIMERSDDIVAKLGGGDVTYSLGRPLDQLAPLFVDEAALDMLQSWAAVHPNILTPTFLADAVEGRMTNANWLRLQGADACAWLSGRASALRAAEKDGGSSAGGRRRRQQ